MLARPVIKWALDLMTAFKTICKIKLSNKPILIVLSYHRILELDDSRRETEIPGMAATPEQLSTHISILKKLGLTPTLFETWYSSFPTGSNNHSFAITFDDGWQDNYDTGLPVLINHMMPATLFLVSDFIGTNTLYWPNKLMVLALTVRENENWRDILKSIAWAPNNHPAFNAEIKTTFNQHFDDLIKHCKKYDDDFLENNIDKALQSLSMKPDASPWLRKEQVLKMIESDLIRIGSHSKTHRRLCFGNRKSIAREVFCSKKQLERDFPVKVSSFCYPNGDRSPTSELDVKSIYDFACTTVKGWNYDNKNSYDIKRINIHDGNGDTTIKFLATLSRFK